MNVGAVLAVVDLASAAVSWLRSRPGLGPAAWPRLADVAVESLIDEAIAHGATVDQARELFGRAARAALAAVGVSASDAEPIADLAASQGVALLRRRLAAWAFARASKSLPELSAAAAAAVLAFDAPPVVEVLPEDVRMKVVPWSGSGSDPEG